MVEVGCFATENENPGLVSCCSYGEQQRQLHRNCASLARLARTFLPRREPPRNAREVSSSCCCSVYGRNRKAEQGIIPAICNLSVQCTCFNTEDARKCLCSANNRSD